MSVKARRLLMRAVEARFDIVWECKSRADALRRSYMEERESNEYERMMQIPDKDLPLHMNESWEFDTVTQEFWKRLKGVDPCLSKDTSTENSSASSERPAST